MAVCAIVFSCVDRNVMFDLWRIKWSVRDQAENFIFGYLDFIWVKYFCSSPSLYTIDYYVQISLQSEIQFNFWDRPSQEIRLQRSIWILDVNRGWKQFPWNLTTLVTFIYKLFSILLLGNSNRRHLHRNIINNFLRKKKNYNFPSLENKTII